MVGKHLPGTLLGFVVEGDLLEIFYHGIHHHQIPPFGRIFLGTFVQASKLTGKIRGSDGLIPNWRPL